MMTKNSMVTLHQYRPYFGVLNMSAPCMKVECFLRMSKIPHKIVSVGNPSSSPSGRLPFIVIDGKHYTDSSRIIDLLTEKFSVDIDAHLSAKERAIGLSLQRLLDDHLYWIALYNRWVDDDYWPIVRDEIFGFLSPFKKWMVSTLVRRDIVKRSKGQGLGLQGKENIYALGIKDIEALSLLLGDNTYILVNFIFVNNLIKKITRGQLFVISNYNCIFTPQ